ncbi:MAG: hypothetical protein B6245_17890 [Desulfobacteraceae bacterium 4572_88]|nr:MAG: hypothetical protein B6245_17890 [Desulfobacteraceae bacterium 4572_88]
MLTQKSLSVLSDDMIAKFRRAVLVADLGAAARLTEQIGQEHSSLADSLTELLDDFRFDTLQELFGKEEHNNSSLANGFGLR